MASGDRFYQLDLRHRPALWGDVGSLLKIEGLVIGGEKAQAVLLLPNVGFMDPLLGSGPNIVAPVFCLTPEEWTDWLQRSDQPEILVQDSLEKAFHRKVRYEISGAVQQKVWMADGLKCMYCGRRMGDVQLSIDHFIPLEIGGKNNTSNYLSCCRRCNKDKGATNPCDWCALEGLDYEFFVDYLKTRKIT